MTPTMDNYPRRQRERGRERKMERERERKREREVDKEREEKREKEKLWRGTDYVEGEKEREGGREG